MLLMLLPWFGELVTSSTPKYLPSQFFLLSEGTLSNLRVSRRHRDILFILFHLSELEIHEFRTWFIIGHYRCCLIHVADYLVEKGFVDCCHWFLNFHLNKHANLSVYSHLDGYKHVLLCLYKKSYYVLVLFFFFSFSVSAVGYFECYSSHGA